MENGTGNHVYHYRTNMGWRAWQIVVAFMGFMATCGAVMICLVFFVFGRQQVSQTSWWDPILLVGSVLLFGSGLVIGISRIIGDSLKARHVQIMIDDSGMSATDWRGRETYIPLNTIQELCLTTFSGVAIVPYAKLIIGPNRFRIELWMENRQNLLDEIISRAHLTSISKDWYQTRYYLPGQIQPTSDALPGHWIICVACLLIPVIGVVFGIYAMRRPEPDWRKTGKYALMAGIVATSFLLYLLRIDA